MTIPAPTLSIVQAHANGISISWTALSDIDQYEIQAAKHGARWQTVLYAVPAVTQVNVSGLDLSTRYRFRVRGQAGDENGEWSNTARESTFEFVGGQTLSDRVTGLTSRVSRATVSLSWLSPINGAASYSVARRPSTSQVYTTLSSTVTARTYTDNVDAGTYVYRVTPQSRGGVGLFANAATVTVTVTARLAPDAPTGVTGRGIDQDSITVSWTASARATSYNVQYRIFGAMDWIAGPTGVTGTSATVNGLPFDNSLYDFQVRAVNSGGLSAWSATGRGRTLETPTVAAPPTPTGVTATAIDHERVTVRWNAAARATSYQVQRRVVGTSLWLGATSGITNTFYTYTGLTEETEYEFQVRAINSGGLSSFSSAVRATTPGEVFAPATPTGLSSVAAGRDMITLTWNTTTGATSYELQHRRSGSTGWSSSNIITGITTTSYTITVVAVTNWDFRIRARNIGGESAWSDFITDAGEEVDPPTTPTGLTISSSADTTITVRWNTVSGAATYEVRRSVLGTSVWNINSGIVTTSYTITGLVSGSGYNIQVRAVNPGGASAWSSSVSSATTEPDKLNTPANLSASASGTSVNVSWDASDGATKYQLLVLDVATGAWSTVSDSITGTSYTHEGRTPGAAYGYGIRAGNDDGVWSEYTLLGLVPYVIVSMAAPTVTRVDADSLAVSWDASPSSGVTYDIRYRKEGDALWGSQVSGRSTTSYQVNGLDANVVYEFQVRVDFESATYGVSDWSQIGKETGSEVEDAVSIVRFELNGDISPSSNFLNRTRESHVWNANVFINQITIYEGGKSDDVKTVSHRVRAQLSVGSDRSLRIEFESTDYPEINDALISTEDSDISGNTAPLVRYRRLTVNSIGSHEYDSSSRSSKPNSISISGSGSSRTIAFTIGTYFTNSSGNNNFLHGFNDLISTPPNIKVDYYQFCLLYTSPSPRDS